MAPRIGRQRGAALLIAVGLLGLIVGGVLYTTASSSESRAEKDRRTEHALAQAKAALIGYAAGRALTPGGGARPGDLPCPDTDGDGTAIVQATGVPESCGPGETRLGRLPWKTLGLPELRDGDGELLWYAVSISYKDAPRTACPDPTAAGCLNSDTPGTITVYDATGRQVLHPGAADIAARGAIALVIAPGAVLRRAGAGVAQDRSAAQINNPASYLDAVPNGLLASLPAGEDNAAFTDAAADGFIQGPVRDAAGEIIVNDRLLAVTHRDLMPVLEQRVLGEVARCLDLYRAVPQNFGRVPEPSPLDRSNGTGGYAGSDPGAFVMNRQGRIPDPPFSSTACFSGRPEATSMTRGWPAACNLPASSLPPFDCAAYPPPSTSADWWTNWKSVVLYAVAQPYTPFSSFLFPPALPACGTCLSIQVTAPPSTATNRAFIVMAAGRRLPSVAGGQPRASDADRAIAANYLEGENNWSLTSVNLFASQRDASATFNDRVLFR